jgi:hypothetical protein
VGEWGWRQGGGALQFNTDNDLERPKDSVIGKESKKQHISTDLTVVTPWQLLVGGLRSPWWQRSQVPSISNIELHGGTQSEKQQPSFIESESGKYIPQEAGMGSSKVV